MENKMYSICGILIFAYLHNIKYYPGIKVNEKYSTWLKIEETRESKIERDFMTFFLLFMSCLNVYIIFSFSFSTVNVTSKNGIIRYENAQYVILKIIF